MVEFKHGVRSRSGTRTGTVRRVQTHPRGCPAPRHPSPLGVTERTEGEVWHSSTGGPGPAIHCTPVTHESSTSTFLTGDQSRRVGTDTGLYLLVPRPHQSVYKSTPTLVGHRELWTLVERSTLTRPLLLGATGGSSTGLLRVSAILFLVVEPLRG